MTSAVLGLPGLASGCIAVRAGANQEVGLALLLTSMTAAARQRQGGEAATRRQVMLMNGADEWSVCEWAGVQARLHA
jgi:hypothetical protein